MTGLENLSDDELKRRYEAYVAAKPQPAQPTKPTIDLSTVSDEDLKKLHAGKQPIEFKDAPTTAQIELPGVVQLPGLLGRITGLDKPAMDVGSKAATLYGTLMTDNPRARQEIYVKHLPGAKAVDDKFGNPMIEYQGKKYYTSRPGEFDAMDAGRVAATTAATFPALAVAPVSLPGAMVAGGLLAGWQEIGGVYGEQADGRASQGAAMVENA